MALARASSSQNFQEILDPGFHQEVKNLEEFWKDEDIGVSRWRIIFRLK
jgi:hypothetical protein